MAERWINDISWDGEILAPTHINIETVFGCNSRCGMCIIDRPTRRKKGVMEESLYRRIVDSVSECRDSVAKFDLIGLGEPLLDPALAERVAYAKGKGIRGVAIATNADLLTPEKGAALLDAGIDTVIFSIDGIRAESHEAIRRGTCFERVVRNAESIMRLRDDGGYAAKFVIRFILQDCNREEWPAFEAYWSERVMPGRDLIMSYGQHNWGGYLCGKDDLVGESSLREEVDRAPCHWVFDVLTVRKDGNVVLCCEDALDPHFTLGDFRENGASAMDIFNSGEFRRIRRTHISGGKCTIPLCRECTVPYSEYGRTVDDD